LLGEKNLMRWMGIVVMSYYVLVVTVNVEANSKTANKLDSTADTMSATLAPQGELYVIAASHLDTQWRWTIRTTIAEYLPATLRDNFFLFEKYPHYTFSFEGAFRYGLMKEYYPAEYARLKKYIAAGRWRVAGSWLDAVDVNISSPESLIRHALYGNGFFKREFGVTSRDVFLPDCFGFGFALPSVAAHCGLTGFSTQKLTWGSAVGIPFEVGLWEGGDGSTLVAAMNPGAYVSRITADLSADSTWMATVAKQRELSGLAVACKYFGTGDQGGAPDDDSVAWLEKSIDGAGPLRVRSVASDQLARDLTNHLTPDQLQQLPRYRGELLMTSHGAGCYTSQAAMKRWNRQNEILADAAERAAVVADWLGAVPYPRSILQESWLRFLWHQFHDDLTGTSIPEAYAYSWNDELLSLNQFASVLTDAVGGVARGLDTKVKGIPLVVYNPLAREREDLVEAEVVFPSNAPASVRVYDPTGREVPSQVVGCDSSRVRVVFVATVPSVGFAVYDIRPHKTVCHLDTGLSCDNRHLENRYYLVTFDESGNIDSIHDKRMQRELLDQPLALHFLANSPQKWAAWEVDYDDVMAPPRQISDGIWPGRVLESGPARVTLEFHRQYGGSEIRQRISLAAGAAGERLEIINDIDWRTPATLLKAAFPLTAVDDEATYDLGLGTVRRGTNTPALYEVPAQRWADLTDQAGTHGVAILNDSRYGWDKPDDHTLRLTLLHTPEVVDGWKWIADQASQDLGRHRLKYSVYGHEGDWRTGRVTDHADRFNQPLLAFQTVSHKGPLGRSFSMLKLQHREGGDQPQVAVRAVKMAEDSEEIVVRLQELVGKESEPLQVVFARPLTAVREVNGSEEPVRAASLDNGSLVVTLAPYQPRTFAVTLADPPVVLSAPVGQPLDLPFNVDGISTDTDRNDGDFDSAGHTLAGDLLPTILWDGGIPYRFGTQNSGWANVLACQGQILQLPEGDFDRLYLLAAAIQGGRRTSFHLENHIQSVWIQDWTMAIGQWDNRLVGGEFVEDPCAIAPAYINRDRVAWIGTHRHSPGGQNEAYRFTYLFRYVLELPRDCQQVVLPDDERIRIVAATAAQNDNDKTFPAQPLYDSVTQTTVQIQSLRRAFLDSVRVILDSPNPDALIRFTLDGTEPTEDSKQYRGSLILTESCVLKARSFATDLEAGRSVEAMFTRLEPRVPVAIDVTHAGLFCRYYEGEWRQIPDFEALNPVDERSVAEVAVPYFAREENIGLVLGGFVQVPREGLYTFHLWSDDGSALYLGEEKIIDNDGLHGRAAETVDLALQAGFYPVRIDFFQRHGGVACELWWEGPGIPLQPIPPGAFSHVP